MFILSLCFSSYVFKLVLVIPFKFALGVHFLAAKLMKIPLQIKSLCKAHLDFSWGWPQRENEKYTP